MTIIAFVLVALGGAMVGATATVIFMGALMEAKINAILDETNRLAELQTNVSVLHPENSGRLVPRGTHPL